MISPSSGTPSSTPIGAPWNGGLGVSALKTDLSACRVEVRFGVMSPHQVMNRWVFRRSAAIQLAWTPSIADTSRQGMLDRHNDVATPGIAHPHPLLARSLAASSKGAERRVSLHPPCASRTQEHPSICCPALRG